MGVEAIESLKLRIEHLYGELQQAREQAEEISQKNLLAEQRLTRELTYSKLLHSISVIVNEPLDYQKAIIICLKRVCRAIDWPVGHAYFFEDEASGILNPTDLWFLDNADRYKNFREVTEKTPFKKGIGLPGRILASSEPAWIRDVMQDSNFPRAHMGVDIVVRGAFGFPLLVGRQVKAVLEFYTDAPFEENRHLMEVMESVGSQMGRVFERWESEENLINAKKEVERVSAAKSEFLGSMSHELRTPLNSILGFSQLMAMNPEELSVDQVKENLKMILGAGNKLLELINQILNFQKIDSGHLKPEKVPVEIVPVIQELMVLLEPMANEYDVRLVNEICGKDNHCVMGDKDSLMQVFFNLMSNAIKFNRKEGSVTVSCEKTPERKLRLSVVDTGPGIEDEKAASLYEPFDRLGKESLSIPGTGIGLATAKRLTELLGGTIGFKNNDGEGSCFFIELPEAPGK